MEYSKELQDLINKQGIRLDLGCGSAKQAGFIGLDIRKLEGVDIVHDLEKFPYPLPDNCCQLIMSSHLVEHIQPHSQDCRTTNLLKLLLDKKIITPDEVAEYVGEIDPGPIFMRMMDELWRIMRVGGQLMLSFPYAGSTGYWQDPTHCNGINEITWAYFDPEEPNTGGVLYRIYEPKPWKIKMSTWNTAGNMEIVLEKRENKPEYHGLKKKTK